METLVVKVPENQSAIIKAFLNELGVTFREKTSKPAGTPNTLTHKTITDAHKGIGLGEPIGDIDYFIKSL